MVERRQTERFESLMRKMNWDRQISSLSTQMELIRRGDTYNRKKVVQFSLPDIE